MRVHLVCNPASGGSTDRGAVEGLLSSSGATLVDEADAERVVVSGGDGTVAQGAELAARLGVPLAVVPTGTANDFARASDIPLDVEAAAALAASGDTTRPRDLARIDGRPFVNVAAAGLSPAAARRAEPLKRVLGPLSYSAGAVLAGALDPPVTCRIAPHFEGRAWQVIVAASGAFGGGAEVDADEGGLDLFVVAAGPRLGLARLALAMRRGTLARTARAAELVIELEAPTAFNVDGEVVEYAGAVAFTVDRSAFTVVTPSDGTVL
jgi:diacylglycerol kinase (ATP)